MSRQENLFLRLYRSFISSSTGQYFSSQINLRLRSVDFSHLPEAEIQYWCNSHICRKCKLNAYAIVALTEILIPMLFQLSPLQKIKVKLLCNYHHFKKYRSNTYAIIYSLKSPKLRQFIMKSSKGGAFRVTSPLCGEFTGHRWIPLTKASDAEFLMFSLVWAWTNGWVNNRDTGDLRRHRAHYDVAVMHQVRHWLQNNSHWIINWSQPRFSMLT